MKRYLPILLAIAILGCSAKPTIVGTWESGSADSKIDITFNADGTFSNTEMAHDMSVVTSGPYTFDGHILSYTVEKAAIGKGGPPQPHDIPKQAYTATVEISGDTMTMTYTAGAAGPAASAVLHRVR